MLSTTAPVPLSDYLTDVRAASDRLIAVLREPIDELGLSREEHLVLLALWDADGLPEASLAEALRLPAALAEQAFQALRQKGLVACDRHDGAAVWLTHEGRQARERVGHGAMRSRLCGLEPDIAALRDMLQHALDLVGEEAACCGVTLGRA